MKEKRFLIQSGGFYFSDAGVSFNEIETDFMKSILFVTKGNGELSFADEEQAQLFANKIFVNLGLECEIVEDNEDENNI